LWDQILGTKAFLIEPIAPQTASFQSASTPTSNEEPEVNPPVSFAGLSPESQKAFQFAYNYSLEEEKRYVAQNKSIDKVKEWIRKTVSPNYPRTCCKPTESIKDWYKNWRKHAGISEYEAETETREEYKKAIKPMPKPYSIMEMSEVRNKNSYRTLANDFREAVRLLTIASNPTKVAKGSFGPVFADEDSEAERLLTKANPTKVVSSFGPAFAL
jgi:hypothetical protein